MNKLVKLLEENARITNRELAVMLDMTEDQVAEEIAHLEKEGIIRGYKAILNWDKIEQEHVTALIEIKVRPQKNYGFEEIAKKITTFDEVESVYLMSGGYDLAVMVKGKTLNQVARFVSHRLSPLDDVLSTATHFILRRYKEVGVAIDSEEPDDRGTVSL